jgi:pimeloyl-ACP methyl ester carboxylesterase
LHGIGNSQESWREVYDKLPENVEIIGLDLLGFGESAKPSWVTYNAKTQAKAVLATLLKYGINRRVIIVGHSMGAIVAVEVARRASFLVSSLVLCSPPFYTATETKKRLFPSTDTVLKDMYRTVQAQPEAFLQLAEIARKAGVLNKSSNISEETISTYFSALEASIINQTSLKDVQRLRMPITILYGAFDGLVVPPNLRSLAKTNDNITAKSVLAGHEITGLYVGSVLKQIKLNLAHK